jgi:DNA-binding NtrC family response regulator
MRAHVLFVDDDANCLAALRRMLHPYHEDWRMTCVGSVDEALNCLNSTAIDTVVSDVQMPGLTGFDLLLAISESSMLSHGFARYLNGWAIKLQRPRREVSR